MRRPKKRPQVLDYTSYRQYMSDMCGYLLVSHPETPTMRSISVKMGFRSQNFLAMVLKGERNLSAKSLANVIHGFGLSRREARYFTKLVQLEQTERSEVRAQLSSDLIHMRIVQNAEDIKTDSLKYLTGKHMITIRELVALDDFVNDPKWIANRLKPRLTQVEVRKAIEALIKMGFLIETPDGGLKNSEKPLTTGNTQLWSKAQSAALATLHKNMAKLAHDAIDTFSREERNFSGITGPLSEEQYEDVKTILAEACQKILDVINSPDYIGPKKEVYRANLQLFPLTKKMKPGAKP